MVTTPRPHDNTAYRYDGAVPRHADHGQRRAQLAEALWTIAERDGLAAATVRGVAAEAGVSVGLVQHYFATKDEMLLFALRWIGESLGRRLIDRVGALPEPRDPYQVVRIVLTERLPRQPRDRIHAQALIAWLARPEADPAVTEYLRAGTTLQFDYLAAQLEQARRDGQVAAEVDPRLAAESLLALTDGLISHVLQGLHSEEHAARVLTHHLRVLFGRPAGP
jgi:TetR/AcrR family transcriptional regulator, transcriptional repressor of bet genes